MLKQEELPGYRVVTFSRISDPSSNTESSLNRQDGQIDEEYQVLEDRFDAEIVSTYRLKESASTIDNDSHNEILEMASNDEFDILMVWAIHRLTRADIYETLDYLLKLKESGIIIYSHQDGYFDWADNNDARRIFDRVINARVWRDSLVEGAVENNIYSLEEGHWPYGPLGYALVDNEEEGIVVKKGYEWIPEVAFDLFQSREDADTVKDILAERIKEQDADLEPPSKTQIETMLRNELYTGRLIERKSGEFVREKEDLAVMDPELFEEVQELLNDSESDDGPEFGPQDFPAFIYELVLRLGQEYIVQNISGIRWCCPVCGSTDIRISDTTIEKWGISIPQIYCHESDCYNGPVIRIKDLENIDSTLPFICPECQRTGDFSVSDTSTDEIDAEMYRYTCNHCGEFMLKDKHPNTYRRALESCNAINLRDGQPSDIDQPATVDKEAKQRHVDDISSKVNHSVSDQAVFEALENWMTDNGPQTEATRMIMLEAAEILDDSGPKNKGELRDQLWSIYPNQYSSPNSLWESTVARFYETTPGFERPGHGRYDFSQEPIRYFLQLHSE
jgi:hypothetical protein